MIVFGDFGLQSNQTDFSPFITFDIDSVSTCNFIRTGIKKIIIFDELIYMFTWQTVISNTCSSNRRGLKGSNSALSRFLAQTKWCYTGEAVLVCKRERSTNWRPDLG